MKKFAKMSLVAALAVAGTAASAQPLTEAIKNVDVSGTIVYRYNDYNDDVNGGKGSRTDNNYKAALTLKSKVNDDVTAVTRFLVAGDNGGFGSRDTQDEGDVNFGVSLSNVYFSYTGLANTTVNVGKQGLTTPWTVAIDADSEEQTGTGILALTTVGPVTLAAAYFNQTNLNTAPAKLNGTKISDVPNIDGSEDVYTIAAMGNIGPVALDAWYLDMEDTFDTYTLGANAKFDIDAVKLGIEARYTSLDFEKDFMGGADVDDQSLWKIILTAKMGIFDAKLGFAGTDKDGGLVALDNDAKTAYQTWNMNPNGHANADFWNASLGVQALESLHISANYTDQDYEQGTSDYDEEELYTQITYKMSKNFSTYIRYGTYKLDKDGNEDTDDLRGRLQVQYSF